MRRPSIITGWIEEWRKLGFYEKFEQITAILLSLAVSIIVVLSVFRLTAHLINVLYAPHQLFDQKTYITLFGMIIVVLIALEFNHTIVQIIERKQSIIQVRIVIIIAMLAIIRKFIVIDLENLNSDSLFALAGVTLALGVTYWLVQDSDRRGEVGRKAE